MHDLSVFGNVASLRSYYGNPAVDEKIERLLSATEALEEAINLCRTAQVPKLLSDFNAALAEANRCDDALLKRLLPAFQDKFGKALTVPSLIRWCLSSEKLQQALTIYNERIPEYILVPGNGFFSAIPELPTGGQSWRDPYSVLLVEALLKPLQTTSANGSTLAAGFRNHLNSVHDNMASVFTMRPHTGNPRYDLAIQNITLIAQAAYPGDGSWLRPSWVNRLPANKQQLKMLQDKVTPKTRIGFLNSVHVWPEAYLNCALEVTDEGDFLSPVPASSNDDLMERLKIALKSGFIPSCKNERLLTVLLDYQFCKVLRNMMNHANDKASNEVKAIQEMLNKNGYPNVDQIGSAAITRQLSLWQHRTILVRRLRSQNFRQIV